MEVDELRPLGPDLLVNGGPAEDVQTAFAAVDQGLALQKEGGDVRDIAVALKVADQLQVVGLYSWNLWSRDGPKVKGLDLFYI